MLSRLYNISLCKCFTLYCVTHASLYVYDTCSYCHDLTLCMLGNFACFLVVCGLFLKLTLSKKSECKTVWIQIRPDFLSGLIWVHTVCKGFQRTTKVATSRERVIFYCIIFQWDFTMMGGILFVFLIVLLCFGLLCAIIQNRVSTCCPNLAFCFFTLYHTFFKIVLGCQIVPLYMGQIK